MVESQQFMEEEDNYAINKFKRGARTELGIDVVKKIKLVSDTQQITSQKTREQAESSMIEENEDT